MSIRTAGHSLITLLINLKYRPWSLKRALATWLAMAALIFAGVLLVTYFVAHHGWDFWLAGAWALIYPTVLLLFRAFSTRRGRQGESQGGG